MKARRIDVHHHAIPRAFVEAASAHGLTQVAGAPLPAWSIERSLDVMDQNDIETALLSLSAPGVHFGDDDEATVLARRCNEELAELARTHPARLGVFAVLPMPATDRACAEAVYALDVLRADGIVLLASTRGFFLGDARFDELMAELDRRAATVFVHPNLHATSDQLGLVAPGFFVEFLCDTSRAALNLVLSGTLERYPRIRFILAHAGGFIPYIAWRLSLANLMSPFDDTAPLGVLHYLRRFYFDTALSPGAPSLAALREFAEPGHILFGSDFPFAPAPITALQTKTLDESPLLDDMQQANLARNNALRLFPRFASGSEVPAAITPARRTSPLQHLGRLGRKPLVLIADQLRKR